MCLAGPGAPGGSGSADDLPSAREKAQLGSSPRVAAVLGCRFAAVTPAEEPEHRRGSSARRRALAIRWQHVCSYQHLPL